MLAAGHLFIYSLHIMKKNKSKKSKKKKYRSPNAIDAALMAVKKGGPILDKEEKLKSSKTLREEGKQTIKEGKEELDS